MRLRGLSPNILKILAIFAVGTVIGWILRRSIYNVLLASAPSGLGAELGRVGADNQLVVNVQLTLFVALALTVPVLLYQGWMTLLSVREASEQRGVRTLLVVASSLFVGGIIFAYFAVLPVGARLFSTLSMWDAGSYQQLAQGVHAGTYLGFLQTLLLGFGLVFYIPAAAYIASRLDLISVRRLARYRILVLVAVLILFVIGVQSMTLLGGALALVAMYLMYELSIVISRYVSSRSELHPDSTAAS